MTCRRHAGLPDRGRAPVRGPAARIRVGRGARAKLAGWFRHPIARLKLDHYSPEDTPKSVRRIGVVPHLDSDALTILWQDDGDGLAIRNLSGE